jgi:hypothetical protein
MNDDRERRRPFLVVQPPVAYARVLAFDMQRPRKPFHGWVGADGNVVPMARPRPSPHISMKDLPRDDEWI